MADEEDTRRTRWHQILLGAVLHELLTPVGVQVKTEIQLMPSSPRADILLIRPEGKRWTREQKNRLPDGIRDSSALHALVEFKYTESLNKRSLRFALAYDVFYKQVENLSVKQVQTYLVSSRVPNRKFLSRYGYLESPKPGVFISSYPLIADIILISLNELEDSPHNAYFKCFASRRAEQRAAFQTLEQESLVYSLPELSWILSGLRLQLLDVGGKQMAIQEITPETLKAMGKKWGEMFIESLPPEERVRGMEPEELLSLIPPEVIRAYLEKHQKEGNGDNG